jgi:hypothetical protein
VRALKIYNMTPYDIFEGGNGPKIVIYPFYE